VQGVALIHGCLLFALRNGTLMDGTIPLLLRPARADILLGEAVLGLSELVLEGGDAQAQIIAFMLMLQSG
jgi:hypothetical protein